tara:strand:- start:98 stop:589 length:492 start_codon:yes stop_codon:yes gene_type:complete
MKKFNDIVCKIANKIYSQLSGFEEKYYQSALGIEFRKKKIDFMREAGLELFYENYPLGLHELDFLITPCYDLKKPLIIETKVASSIIDSHRQQLKNYLRSAAKNKNVIIKNIEIGMLLNFNNSENIAKSIKKKKENQNVEIEFWEYKNNKFSQISINNLSNSN